MNARISQSRQANMCVKKTRENSIFTQITQDAQNFNGAVYEYAKKDFT